MYLPSLGELLEGLQRIMETAVIPALDDPYALVQARAVSLQLGDLIPRWEAAGDSAARENEELRAILADCARVLEDGVGGGTIERTALPVAATIRAQLARVYPIEPPRRSVASIAQEGQDLGTAMELAILELERLQHAAPGDAALKAARVALRSVIRQQAERRDPKVDSSQIQHRN